MMKKGVFMKRNLVSTADRPTIPEECLKEIEEAKKHPITYDEDCPRMSPRMHRKFLKRAIERRKVSN